MLLKLRNLLLTGNNLMGIMMTLMCLVVPAVGQSAVTIDFNELTTLPEGWWVDGEAAAYAVADGLDYSGRAGSRYRSLEHWDINSDHSTVVTPCYGGLVAFSVRAYGKKRECYVKVYEYIKNGDTYTRGNEITTAAMSWNASNTDLSWQLIQINCGTNGKYLGIELSRANLDNFFAEKELEGGGGSGEEPQSVNVKAMTLTAFKRVSDYEVTADKDNRFSATFSVTLQNTGSVQLAATEAAVSIVDANGNVVATALSAQPVDVEAMADVTVDVTAEAGDGGYVAFYARENIGNTYFKNSYGNNQAANLHITPCKAQFAISDSEGYKLWDGETVDFGTRQKGTTRQLTIANDGTAPLTVSSISMPAGFSVTATPFDVEVGAKKTIDITLDIAEPFGKKGGEAVINHDLGNFAFNVSGYCIDPEACLVDFEDGLPQPWMAEAGWDVRSQKDNHYAQQGNPKEASRLITQRLYAPAGGKLVFEARRAYAYSPATLSVYISRDGEEWTPLKSFELTSQFTTYTIDFDTPTTAFVAFEGQYVAIDDVWGMQPATADEHLVEVVDVKMDTTATVNYIYNVGARAVSLVGTNAFSGRHTSVAKGTLLISGGKKILMR